MVGHLKSIMRNVYNGLIWFGVLIMLMVSNDSFAWLFRVSCFVFRVSCGRKLIHKDVTSCNPRGRVHDMTFE
jgi:hypothetical protein